MIPDVWNIKDLERALFYVTLLIESGYVLGHNDFICLNDKKVRWNLQITVTDPLFPADQFLPHTTLGPVWNFNFSLSKTYILWTRKVYGLFNIWSMKKITFSFEKCFSLLKMKVSFIE